MIKNNTYLFKSLVFIGLCIAILSCSTQSNDNFKDTAKVALRDVGHHLLLNSQDSTSLVKPVVTLDDNTYQLSFEKNLVIQPDSLVAYVKKSLKKAGLPKYYLTEVIQCDDHQVAYSYQMKDNIEKGIIPCGGRELNKGCYIINIKFNKLPKPNTSNTTLIVLLILGVFGLLAFLFYKQKSKIVKHQSGNYASIGRYKFYPEQNKLIKEATEISLSKKECELLSIFIANPNLIVTRDELTKKVWEDHGVIVGRSLDTYISKLRKKLQDDDTIKLTNVHGVGYKLEVN